MNAFQLVGLLVIINSIAWAIWQRNQSSGLGLGGIIILAFALVSGLALVFYQRAVEINFGKEGASIKAAAAQATADAAEIKSIRDRVEAQAATIDLVAKDSAEAKKLVDSLRKESERADEKLKMLEEKTSQIERLPDGRMKTGATITGTPTILIDLYKEMQTAYQEKRFPDAYSHARAAIEIYEATAKILNGIATLEFGGEVNQEALVRLYSIGAEGASQAGDPQLALKWHTVAYLKKPLDPELTATHVLVLMAAGKTAAAQKLVDDTIAKNDDTTARFKMRLIELGVIPK